MRIKTRRNQNHLRAKATRNRPDDSFEDLRKACVTCPSGNWNVDGRTDALALTDLGDCACAGIPGKLVSRKEQYIGVRIENILCSIAVMNIVIDDHDALDTVTLLRIAGRNRNICEQAKAHAHFGSGVMARWAD